MSQNERYLDSNGITGEARETCLAAMAKYGDNRWWEPDVDPRKLAYYQLNEPILMGDFSHFHEAIELLLGRPVFTHEFAISADALKQEAERAWVYQVGVTSDQERQERVQQSVESLQQWAQEHKKPLLIAEVQL